MQDGRRRAEVEYVWPTKIARPAQWKHIVYLDLNHWITLAKEYAPQGREMRDAVTLAACAQAHDSHDAVFPISSSTYFELAQIGSDRHRRDLRRTIEHLSEFRTLMAPTRVIQYEVEAILDAHLGASVTGLGPTQYIGQGWAHALDASAYAEDVQRMRDSAVDKVAGVSSESADLLGRVFDDFQLQKERAILDGPGAQNVNDSMVPHLRVEGIRDVQQMRLRQELSLRNALNDSPNSRQSRIRDVVMTRSVDDDIMRFIVADLARRKLEFGDVFNTREQCRELFDAMPSCDAMVTIKTMYHRNPNHPWKVNDIYDIDALSTAIPYCDFVLTDRAVASQASDSGLAERLGKRVLHSLDDLLEIFGHTST